MRKRLRKLWLTTHRWIGLTVGLLFVLSGFSGSLLVFDHAIDEWLHPEMLLTTGSGSPRPLEEVLTAAEDAFSDAQARAHFVEPPRVENGVWTVWFQSGSDEAPRFTQVYVDPYTSEVTGRRVWGEYLMTWIYRLHDRLLGGHAGETIVGIVGLVLMISLGTGICLWWPLWKNSWRSALALRGGRRFNYDLHKIVGIASSLILLVIAFTGVYMIFPGWIKPVVHVVSSETIPPPEARRSKPGIGRSRIDAEQAADAARQYFPDGELKRLQLPADPDGAYIARIRRTGEVRRSSGNSRLWIDQYSGEVVGVRDWNRRTAADTFFAWQFPLHNGEAFGLTGRWIVVVTGLTPGVLYVTGFLLWWRKRQSRKRQLRGDGRARIDKRETLRDSLLQAPQQNREDQPAPSSMPT